MVVFIVMTCILHMKIASICLALYRSSVLLVLSVKHLADMAELTASSV